ncbi:MAG: ATP-binding protein [Planctomycetota bacterium]
MGFINVAERTINAKLVYYGVGVGGKTTSLQQVHGIFCPRNEVQLVSINTEEESTLLFDFLPINLGTVGGFKIRVQGFTVPGQPKYKRMRKYVLQGADAVVFVVDSQRSRLEENLESLRSMQESLREQASNAQEIPIIVQYNKRDLDDVMSEPELDEHFRFRDDVAAFPSVATEGQGVFEAFVEATVTLVKRKVALYGLSGKDSPPDEVAESVRQKLWDICDEVRRGREVVAVDDLPQTRLSVADQPRDVPDDDVLQLDERSTAPGSAVGASDEEFEELDLESALADMAAASSRLELAAAAEEGAPNIELFDSAGSVEDVADPVDDEDGRELNRDGGGAFDFGYELRDRAAAEPTVLGDVLTDDELDLDLDAGLAEVHCEASERTGADDGSDEALLDQTVHSNLELARRFGELDEKRLLLERKVHELVDVAQCTVHDLNRPISAVRLMLSTLLKGYLGSMSGQQEQAIENGLMAVNQMERLVRDLLDSSRLDHDGMQLQFESADLTLVVADVLRTLRYELEENGLQVRVEPLPVVSVDAWALTKALLNLIGNAMSYRSQERTPLVQIFCEDRGDDWSLAIRDNGIGIPAADCERLFRRFERGSNTGGISGTGLGLHIVKEIVQGHGGSVHFESEVGVGTTFWLNLPKQPVLAPHSSTTETAARADL